jgi:hypothetical protein
MSKFPLQIQALFIIVGPKQGPRIAAGHFSRGGEQIMSQIQPEGEEIRKAIKWISANLEEGKKKSQLIEEAALKFDLSPAQTDFLLNFFTKKPA